MSRKGMRFPWTKACAKTYVDGLAERYELMQAWVTDKILSREEHAAIKEAMESERMQGCMAFIRSKILYGETRAKLMKGQDGDRVVLYDPEGTPIGLMHPEDFQSMRGDQRPSEELWGLSPKQASEEEETL
jgi:hypothetical protein